MAKNLEKALYGPSILEVALGAFLGLALGLIGACVFLVFKPVQTVLEMPPAAKIERGVVYYQPGREVGGKSKGWQIKQKQFVAGTTVTVVEDELNAWASTIGAPGSAPAPQPKAEAKDAKGAPAKTAAVPPKPAAAKPPAPGAAPAKPAEPAAPALEGVFIPGRPNFRIADGKVQIGLTCTLNWYGLSQDVVVKSTGVFRRDGDEVEYVPETFYLGSCPMHLLPVLGKPLAAHLIAREKIPDDISTAWKKLRDVAIDGQSLRLIVQ